jgi:nucleoside-diphosphate-sugar epimerase
MNVLITGDKGYIGSSLTRELKETYNITSINRDVVDLTDKRSVRDFFIGKHFDVVIHTAIVGGHRLVKDDAIVTHNNLAMFYNILENKSHYNRLINFSSGGEKFTETPYGLSKNIITQLCNNIDDFFNLKLFGVFDENELHTRFIKTNLHRYIRNEAMIIHKNKFMDFFYMHDLINVVKYYITIDSSILVKNIDCVYEKKHTLKDIVDIINTANNYNVNVNIEDTTMDDSYIGDASVILKLPIKIGDLASGILTTYRNLL